MHSYPSTSKPSIHKRFVAGFVRHACGDLVHCFGPAKAQLEAKWSQVRPQVLQNQCYNAYPNRPSQTTVRVEQGLDVTDGSHGGQAPSTAEESYYSVFETLKPSAKQVVGIVLRAQPDEPTPEDEELDLFFSSLVLSALRVDTTVDKGLLQRIDVRATTEAIVDLFDHSLRYASKNDKWFQGGREVFRESVSSFTSRGKMIEFCLPAFPCKSSCTGKVLTTAPDRGEYLALSNMHAFVQAIEALYEPGAKLWVISDGHVFSDCIGVDDDVVDTYGAQLQAMNRKIVQLRGGGKDRIGFRSLPELFGSYDKKNLREQLEVEKVLPELEHHIPTAMTDEAEVCRKILTEGFQLDSAELRSILSAQDASMVALYRGFSKFMLEDLTTNKYTSHLSRTQLRKKSAKVAFEMIQRNQAYSNLVQMLFPHHVRLSIHAHDNAGPKFGIQMLGRGVLPTDVLPPNGKDVQSCDKLHVPTPWHNCVVQIEGYSDLYITKSSVAHSALSSDEFTGRVVVTADQGEYVYLRQVRKTA
ncbi:hypothetical protein QQS21_012625 [Conoideocrella luteorostrata]|uniref:Pyoverdine/dityrosine biosynthesis protein n=1 Tax=Conoideocrella luteorostrata TaxID=1105319 RepID=A0AAJ0CAV1_9HYPO|nr:hypothetical protein QQS21_012625 [Conoideocrella luteorostrata]